MSIPPAASTAPTWFATAAPVANAGPVLVGPTGVAVAEPPLVGAPVVTVPLPIGTGAPLAGAEIVEIKVVGPTPVPEGVVMGVPEEQGTVMVVPSVTIVVYEITDAVVLVVTEEAEDAVVTVVVGVQSGRVKVPL